MLARGAELIRTHAAIFAVLTIWAFAPLVAVLAHVASHGGMVTGAYGVDTYDQFQYLAWIRDEGNHILASNLWTIAPSAHDYVQPMYLISAALWGLGLSLQLAYLIWLPVAVLVVFLGAGAYVRRMLPRSGGQQAAALILVLFYQSPVYAIVRWTGGLSAAHRFQLLRITIDPDAALQLWGFAHTAIAIGLMPVFLLACEKLLRADAPVGRRWLLLATICGGLVSWIYPWQGATLLVIVGGLWVVGSSRRRFVRLAVPVLVTALPLIYTEILAHADSSWHHFQSQLAGNMLAPLWTVIAGFAALVIVAACGVRRPRDDGEWMLLLWPLATVAVYVFGPNTSPHALAGITMPLGVLAVRGWVRVVRVVRAPRAVAASLAVAALAVFTVPAAVRSAEDLRGNFAPSLGGALAQQLMRLTHDQAKAIAYLDQTPRAGGVLAPWFISMSIPVFTDRQVFTGHLWWGPPANLQADQTFFNPLLRGGSSAAIRRAILRRSRAVFVLAGCGSPPSLARDIAPLARPVRQFGCVTVYETS